MQQTRGWAAALMAFAFVAAYTLVVPLAMASPAHALAAQNPAPSATPGNGLPAGGSVHSPPGNSQVEKHLVGAKQAIHALKEIQLKSTGHL